MDAFLQGSWRHPRLLLRFGFNATHPRTGKYLRDWVKTLENRWFDKEAGGWIVTGIGPHPHETITDAGFTIRWVDDPDSDLAGVRNLDELVTPIARLHDNGRRTMVRHRFLGREATEEIVGWGATWDQKRSLLMVPTIDLLGADGKPRPGIIHDENAIAEAVRIRNRPTVPPELAGLLAKAGSAPSLDVFNENEIATLRSINGVLPAWFGLPLFPFQEVGALAAAAGHNCLFDSPRVGKTRSSLAAATLLKSHRTLIVSPPLVLLNWERNVLESGLHNRGGKTDGRCVVFKTGRKQPELPETGVVIVSDSLVAARPELKELIVGWKPQVTIVDEAHRQGTYGTKRCEAVLDLAHITEKMVIPLTGTPIFSSPTELTPLIEMSGHIGPVFGGVDPFLRMFTTRDKWGRNHAKKRGLEALKALLRQHVWVRRTKEQVGIGMKPSHDGMLLEVDLKLFRQAHDDVLAAIAEWVEWFEGQHDRTPNDEDVQEFAATNLGLLSAMRKAAGMAKIPAATELITEHIAATTEQDRDGAPVYNRPLIVWTHHRDVTEAMAAALDGKVEGSAMIIGGMSDTQKDDVVARFQAGKIPVLAASIIAAGVGIDLTRSSDVLFVETDWTPANVQQALDRVNGVNQSKPISAITMIAKGTLDERIQKVQHTKGKTLEAVLGGGDHDVSVAPDIGEMRTAKEIVVELTNGVLALLAKQNGKRAA
ncbi:DEAD/DEAH box helicase [Agromyces humi]|uniref:DEAD/DEAH box helicase n=1 Tax=Agromyces humi TaxID=1766800 RepID=UPI00135CF00B|nr:DEAD/DEAH box helicase [Agromyces humi]